MFNVVIEKEHYDKIDPLVITEDINLIIQSIEEQLYNINVSYRNNVRKIKNNLKSLEGVSESKLVILDESEITDDNLISYLTNVLEISLDCVVSTLYEVKEYRSLLSNVACLDDLFQIDHPNVKTFSKVIENCKELFTIYSDVNNKLVSTTSFYTILDQAIENSVRHNIQTVNIDDPNETRIYNLVIENLDTLVDLDLTTTFDNIKTFSANQVVVQENWLGTVWRFIVGQQWWARQIKTLVTLSAIVLGFKKLYDWINGQFPTNPADFEFSNFNGSQVQALLSQLLSKQITLDAIPIDERLIISQYLTNGNTPVDEREFIIASLNKLGVTNISEWLHTSLESIKSVTKQLEDEKNKVQHELELLRSSAGPETVEINRKIEKLQDLLNSLAIQYQQDLKKSLDLQTNINNQLESLSKMTDLAQGRIDKAVAEAIEYIQSLGVITVGSVTAVSVGLAVIVYFVTVSYLRKRIFLTSDAAKTITSMLTLRKKIDKLRKDTIMMFPELKIQFTQLDNEVIKCERESVRVNNVIMAYQCSMKYFMGSYAIVLFSALRQLAKDGNNLNSFNTLDSVHNFNGFASLKTRNAISELNVFYNLMIEYDTTMIDVFEKIFYLVKNEILQDKSLADITKKLPLQFALGRN